MKLCGLIGLNEIHRILEQKKKAKIIFQRSLILGALFEILAPIEHLLFYSTWYV